jgi:hypothetical protein
LEKVKVRLPAGLRGEEREIMKNVVLNNGVEMLILGFGVYQKEASSLFQNLYARKESKRI